MLTEELEKPFNIASLLTGQAQRRPDALAVVAPHAPDALGRGQLTFLELEQDSSRLAEALNEAGFMPGSRTVLMVKPGLDFFLITFALFKAGVIPVVVDPGMGLKRMLRCLAQGRPQGFIGPPRAQIVRLAVPRYFRSVKVSLSVGRRRYGAQTTLAELLARPASGRWPPPPSRPEDLAAILFTTGSTGPAKGVCYTHAMFAAQVRHIQESFGLAEGEIDLPTFPLFALFDPALGVTAVLPRMNPIKPARVHPLRLIEPIQQYQVSNLFASPAILRRLGDWAEQRSVKLRSLKRVISAGAPVPPKEILRLENFVAEGAHIITPYGATEAVPLTYIGSEEILKETRAMTEQGFGMCVGRPLPGLRVEVIKLSDKPIDEWSDQLLAPVGEIGELAARGDVVSRHYFERPQDDLLAKIPAADGCFWHRMGDAGWRDRDGRLWFCGRKSQRVITALGPLFTIPCEAIFNNHPWVLRTALVGLGPAGGQTPVIVVETKPGFSAKNWPHLAAELEALAQTNPRTRTIRIFLRHPAFPVDIRHNAKIFRERLADWAARRLAGENP